MIYIREATLVQEIKESSKKPLHTNAPVLFVDLSELAEIWLAVMLSVFRLSFQSHRVFSVIFLRFVS